MVLEGKERDGVGPEGRDGRIGGGEERRKGRERRVPKVTPSKKS